jgi:Sulfotransferase domain
MPFDQKCTTGKESAAIALMKQRLSGFETEFGRLQGLSYQPRAETDVVISTTPKAGTTWMQQICHQLRVDPLTSGDKQDENYDDDDDDLHYMDFDEISEVVPWLELAHDQGQDLAAPQYMGRRSATGGVNDETCAQQQQQHLRLFKTHAWADHCPPFSRVIVVLRDPCDTLVSFYHFFEDWFFEPGTVSLDAFAREFWLSRGVPSSRMENASYFVHLISWYQRYMDEMKIDEQQQKILFVCFEDLQDDLEFQVRRVASFLSSNSTTMRYDSPERISAAVRRSTFAFMKEHEGKFDEKLSKTTRNAACGLPPDAGLRKTKIGRHHCGNAAGFSGKLHLLSDDLIAKVQEKWTQIVEPVTGCLSYLELRQRLAAMTKTTQ